MTTAPHRFGSLLRTTFAGQVMDGASVSLTVTLKEQVGPAFAVQVTGVVPFAKNDPDTGTHVTIPQVPSVDGAEKFTTAPHCPGILD